MKHDKGNAVLPTGIVWDIIAILDDAKRSKRFTSRLRRRMSALSWRLRISVASASDGQVKMSRTLLKRVLRSLPHLLSVTKDARELVHALIGKNY